MTQCLKIRGEHTPKHKNWKDKLIYPSPVVIEVRSENLKINYVILNKHKT
jgi:hypothetical protein